MKYEKLEHVFTEREKLLNNNGYEYEVLKVIDQDNVIFKRITDGEIVQAYMPNMYRKVDKGLTTNVLEWEIGKYVV